MSILSNKALHEQLSIIMGALTKAAVLEICEVVDEGYAVLQMEISRSHKENEDLKKKLHLIESIVVRGSGGGHAPEGGAEVVPRSGEEARQADSPREEDAGEAASAAGADGEAAGAARLQRKELPDVVLIKDEDSDSNDSEDGGALSADGASSALSEGGASAAGGRRRRRRSHGTEDAERSPSSERPDVKTSRRPGSKMGVYALESLTAEPACSFADCSLVSPSAGRKTYFAVMEEQSACGRAELDPSGDPSWTAPFLPGENVDGDAFGLKLVSVSGGADGRGSGLDYDGSGVMSFGLYREPAGRSQKRFVCSMCNKTYANSQNLEVHTRIHTGERPFSCDQCGKKFTQSAHLRSHLNIHSGERPFVCTLCSKSFIVKYSLKLHMKKYHPGS